MNDKQQDPWPELEMTFGRYFMHIFESDNRFKSEIIIKDHGSHDKDDEILHFAADQQCYEGEGLLKRYFKHALFAIERMVIATSDSDFNHEPDSCIFMCQIGPRSSIRVNKGEAYYSVLWCKDACFVDLKERFYHPGIKIELQCAFEIALSHVEVLMHQRLVDREKERKKERMMTNDDHIFI